MSETTPKSWLDSIGYQAFLLGSVATLATALLAGAQLLTQDDIAAREREDLQASLNQVIPAPQYEGSLLDHTLELPGSNGKPLTIYRGLRGQQVSALAWNLSGQGYAGEIRLMLGLDANGSILGVRVLSHTETPGLGDKIEEKKSPWILGFNGLSLGNPPPERWKVKKDGGQFDAFSGATITPRAVVKAIHEGLLFFQQHREELLKLPVEVAKP